MERILQGSDAREQATGERWDGGHGGSITPFKFPDESPSRDEWRLHHCSEDSNKDNPLGFKESWGFGKVVFKRYYRYDWKEASLHRALGSWTGDSVNYAASRLLGVDQVGCTYSIRIRGISVTISGGSGTLQRLIAMAIRLKCSELQLASSEVEGDVSRGCPETHQECEESELDRLFSEGMTLRSGTRINCNL
nr:MAG: putative symptom severity modulator [Zeavirus sp.]